MPHNAILPHQCDADATDKDRGALSRSVGMIALLHGCQDGQRTSCADITNGTPATEAWSGTSDHAEGQQFGDPVIRTEAVIAIQSSMNPIRTSGRSLRNPRQTIHRLTPLDILGAARAEPARCGHSKCPRRRTWATTSSGGMRIEMDGRQWIAREHRLSATDSTFR